jgi:hypothetical protein
MDKVYQVIEGFYFYGETQETLYGTYSTEEKAVKRKNELLQRDNICEEHLYIKEIILNVDIE